MIVLAGGPYDKIKSFKYNILLLYVYIVNFYMYKGYFLRKKK